MSPTSMIVFHWRCLYSQAAQIQATLEGREPTIEDAIADGNEEPLYSCTAFAVPPGINADRDRLRLLLEAAGFRKDAASATWVARHAGEAPAVALKAILENAAVAAVHYHDVPSVLIVGVHVDGLL